MASITKKRDLWVVRWRDGGRGSPQRTSPGYRTKAEAQTYAASITAREHARRAPAGITITGLDLAARWRDHLAACGRTPRYVELAAERVARALGRAPLTSLRLSALRQQPIGARRVIQACLRWGVKELHAAVPPECLSIPASAPRRPQAELMPDDTFQRIQTDADAIGPSLGAIVHLVGTYGHRPESLAHLTAADLDNGQRLTLRVKGGDTIRHPILPATAARLAELAADHPSGPILRDERTGKAYPTGHAISVRYRSCLGRGRWKPEPGIYALKRRAISAMLGRGLDPATVASITGHRRPDILLRHYARTNETRQTAALAVLADLASPPKSAAVLPGAPPTATTTMRRKSKNPRF